MSAEDDVSVQPPPVSPRCVRGLHSFCTGTVETCGCVLCHFVCGRCTSDCRTIYGDHVCASCYRDETRGQARERCEFLGCVSTRAYLDLRHRVDGFLCIAHHRVMGHSLGRWETKPS